MHEEIIYPDADALDAMTRRPLGVGDAFESFREVTDADIRWFAVLTGDANPLHLDDATAVASRFGRRVAHGLLVASLIPTTIARHLPGVVYLNQTLRFSAPVFPGDTVRARVVVTHVRGRVVTMFAECARQTGETVVSGEAVVLWEV